MSSTSSTNSDLREKLSQRALPEGFTIRALHQTSGRGQFGNRWKDEAGANLLFSTLFRPNFLQASEQFGLNMSVCLALVESLNAVKAGFQIKWPNDILYNGQKVAGVLIENSLLGSRIESSIVGIGLNVNQRDFGDLPTATSLSSICGAPQDIDALFIQILEKLDVEYTRLRLQQYGLEKRFLQHLYGFGKRVPIELEGVQAEAFILGVRSDGKLHCRIEGEMHYFAFKEIKFILNQN